MTHHQSALSSLLQELLDDPSLAHEELFRRLLQAGLQDLIDAEATVRVGADRYQRSEQRVTRRNRTRVKNLATPAGQLELAIPKLREGSFFPSLLHPRRRVDKALYSVICTAWIEGVSTRKVDELVKALGNQTGISKSSVSRICGDIDEVVSAFLTRPPGPHLVPLPLPRRHLPRCPPPRPGRLPSSRRRGRCLRAGTSRDPGHGRW